MDKKKILNNLGKIVYNGEKWKAFPLRQEKKVEDTPFHSSVQPRTGRANQDSNTGKRIQGHLYEKGNP